jgi:hypothetical protein
MVVMHVVCLPCTSPHRNEQPAMRLPTWRPDGRLPTLRLQPARNPTKDTEEESIKKLTVANSHA